MSSIMPSNFFEKVCILLFLLITCFNTKVKDCLLEIHENLVVIQFPSPYQSDWPDSTLDIVFGKNARQRE